jgi:hypothetical protein
MVQASGGVENFLPCARDCSLPGANWAPAQVHHPRTCEGTHESHPIFMAPWRGSGLHNLWCHQGTKHEQDLVRARTTDRPCLALGGAYHPLGAAFPSSPTLGAADVRSPCGDRRKCLQKHNIQPKLYTTFSMLYIFTTRPHPHFIRKDKTKTCRS